MWNGFLRITGMIGVIGVGLFAVYHAQKHMNFTVPGASEDSRNERVKIADTESSSADEQSGEPASDEQPDVELTETESKPATDDRQRSRQRNAELKLASLDDDTSEPVPPKTTVTTKKNPPRIAAPKQAASAKNESSFDDDSLVATDEPKQKPKMIPAAKRSPKSEIRNVAAKSLSDTDSKELDASTEETDSAVPEIETDSLTADSTASEEINEAPKTAPVNVGFDDFSSPPPRSKRALQNAGKVADAKTETEATSFDADSKSSISQTSNTSEPAGLTEELQSVPTEPLPKQSRSSFSELEASPPEPPRPLSSYSDNAPKQGSPPAVETPSRPLDLFNDFDSDRTSRPTRSNRDASSRRRDTEIRPVDMIGDGVAGDPSQRGVQLPRLSIEKKAQQQAVLGQPLIYEIVVKNTGSVDAHNVIIEDRIPKGAELKGTSPQAELSGRRLIWNQPLLKPNEEKKISIKVIPTQEGSIGSVARVYFATEVTAEIVVSAPQLEFTVKAPREVKVGQRFDLVYVLKNVGKVDATNIVVRDIVPDELKNDTGVDIECPLGTLAPDDVREIVLPVTAQRTGSVTNKAILTADTGIKKTLESPIEIVGEVLVLTRTGQNRLYVERPAIFTNNIRNDGNQRAERVKVSEVVPAGMQFASASDGGRFDPKSNAVVWTLGPLPPGGEQTVNVKYVPKEIGNFDAKITAVGAAGSTASINAPIDVVGKPELQMETLSATGTVTIGDRITSKFQLNNTGTAAASNVQLVVRLPQELRLISVTGANFKQVGDDVIFEPILQFDPRKKVSYELVLEPVAEADAQIGLEISADHLTKPGRRVESIQIASDPLR
jgi:uncharacterized repeat protein (TIGR01451 family)